MLLPPLHGSHIKNLPCLSAIICNTAYHSPPGTWQMLVHPQYHTGFGNYHFSPFNSWEKTKSGRCAALLIRRTQLWRAWKSTAHHLSSHASIPTSPQVLCGHLINCASVYEWNPGLDPWTSQPYSCRCICAATTGKQGMGVGKREDRAAFLSLRSVSWWPSRLMVSWLANSWPKVYREP